MYKQKIQLCGAALSWKSCIYGFGTSPFIIAKYVRNSRLPPCFTMQIYNHVIRLSSVLTLFNILVVFFFLVVAVCDHC